MGLQGTVRHGSCSSGGNADDLARSLREQRDLDVGGGTDSALRLL